MTIERSGSIPAGEEEVDQVDGRALERGALLTHGDRVQVDGAVDAVVRLLHGDPVADGAQVVAKVQRARRLGAAEDARPARRLGLGAMGCCRACSLTVPKSSEGAVGRPAGPSVGPARPPRRIRRGAQAGACGAGAPSCASSSASSRVRSRAAPRSRAASCARGLLAHLAPAPRAQRPHDRVAGAQHGRREIADDQVGEHGGEDHVLDEAPEGPGRSAAATTTSAASATSAPRATLRALRRSTGGPLPSS